MAKLLNFAHVSALTMQPADRRQLLRLLPPAADFAGLGDGPVGPEGRDDFWTKAIVENVGVAY